MNHDDDTESPGMICIRCGQLNDAGASRCARCKSPLDDFAASSPWEMGTAEAPAYGKVVSPRTKPIIFWGAWLYFGPSAVGSLWMIGAVLYPLIGDQRGGIDVGESVMLLLMPLGYGALSIWALWAVSKGYFTKG